jgi:hypothetical protein
MMTSGTRLTQWEIIMNREYHLTQHHSLPLLMRVALALLATLIVAVILVYAQYFFTDKASLTYAEQAAISAEDAQVLHEEEGNTLYFANELPPVQFSVKVHGKNTNESQVQF